MARRVSLPAADDLFRPTNGEGARVRAVPDQPDNTVEEEPRKPSGRVRHDEKMTVYVTSDELVQIEHARLTLRSQHRLAVDRGRLVREALSLVLTDLETNGADSVLVQRLTEK